MTEQNSSGTAPARGLFEQLIFNYSSQTAVSQPFSKLTSNTNENSFDNHALNYTPNTQYDNNRRNKQHQHNNDTHRRKLTSTINNTNENKDANRNAMNRETHVIQDGEVNRTGNPLLNDTTNTGITENTQTQHTQRRNTRCTDDTDIVKMDKPRLNDESAQEQQCQHLNTHHTSNQPDHDANSHTTYEPHNNHYTDKEQHTYKQNTDKTDALHLPTTIFTKLEEIFCAQSARNYTPTQTEQTMQSPTTTNDYDTTSAPPPNHEGNKPHPSMTLTTAQTTQTHQPHTTRERTKPIQPEPRARTHPAIAYRPNTKNPRKECAPPMRYDEDDIFEQHNTDQTTNAAPLIKARQDKQSTTHTSWLNTDDYPEWLLQFAGNKRTKRVKTSSSTEITQSKPHNTRIPNPENDQQTIPALTIYNTTFIRKVAPTHSPHLAQPHESWDNSCFGTIDLSQCILKEPSVLTQHDFDVAREHLKNQIRNNPHDHQPPKPAQSRILHTRKCNTT